MAFLELAGLTRRYPRPIAGFIAPDAGGHLRDLNLGEGPATVIGSSQRVAPRFAAFAKGTGIHADDGNDTQLAVAKDRVVATLRDLEPLGFIDRLLTPLRF